MWGLPVDLSPERFDHLFDSVSVALCAIDGDGNILRINPTTHKLLEWDPVACQGQPLARYLHEAIIDPAQALAWTVALSDALTLGKSTYLNVPSRFHARSGQDNLQLLSGLFMAVDRTDDTQPGVILAMYEHDTEQSLEAARARLFSPMALELEPPMTNVAVAADLLAATQSFQEGRQRRLLNIIQTEIAKVQRITAQFMADPPPAERPRPLLLHVVSLPPLLHRMAQVFALRGTGHTILLQIQPDLPDAWGNADNILQVLNYLIDNALNYAPPASTITLSAQAEPDSIRIGIVDEGPGLPPEEQAQLFQPHPRSQEANIDVRKQGMGLSISMALVKSMGGVLAYEDLPGGKHRFFFTLPRFDRILAQAEWRGD